MKKFTTLLTLIFLSLSSSISFAQSSSPSSRQTSAGANYIKAANIFSSCKKYFTNTFRTRENIARKATCNGYFFGIGGVLLSLQSSGVKTGLCLPGNLSTEQIIKEYIDWAQKSESNMQLYAAESVLTSLKENYSC